MIDILNNFEANEYSVLEWSSDSKGYDTRKVEELLAYARFLKEKLDSHGVNYDI